MKLSIRKILLICSLPATLVFTGCFEITEEASFNKDGSGNYALTFDLSKTVKQLGLTDLKQISEGDAELDSLKRELSSVKGISDVQQTVDNKNGIIKIAFKFADLNALNEVMRLKNKAKSTADDYFTMVGKNFQRTRSLPGISSDLEDEIEKIKQDADDEGTLKIVGSIVFKSIYKFDRKVDRCSNKRAVVAKNGKEVSLTFTVREMLEKAGDVLFENMVTFR